MSDAGALVAVTNCGDIGRYYAPGRAGMFQVTRQQPLFIN
jgi:hypothetical protein